MKRNATVHEKVISTQAGRERVAREMRERGHSIPEIARSVERAPSTVRDYLRKVAA